MAQHNHLSDLERHVQLLEEKVNKLRSSLNHWQQWYFEYATLKEEVDQLAKDPATARKGLARIRRDYDGELLNKKELNEIIGKNDIKEPQQVLTLVSRRMDYVEQNIESLTKLLQTEENRLSAAIVIARPDGGTDEETGLPITDIIEELDEDGNVVQFRLQTGADAGSKVEAALEKAGVRDIAETEADLIKTAVSPQAEAKGDDATNNEPGTSKDAAPEKPELDEASGPQTIKKSVSFAEDTKPGNQDDVAPISRNARKVEELMKIAREQEAMDMSKAVIPTDESAEDSALRRQMLDYTMSDIGPVVAELQLEEGTSGEENWDSVEEETDDEDELGRSKHSVITDDYIRRMQELEKRLQGQTAFTVQPLKPPPVEDGVGKIRIMSEPKPEPELALTTSAPAKPKVPKEAKSVRFAPSLDIAEEKQATAPKPPKPVINPIGDVVEKSLESVPMEADDEDDEPPKRVSRFKKERAAPPSSGSSINGFPPGPMQIRPGFFNEAPGAVEPVEPTPPEGQPLSSVVVERNANLEATGPDDMDDALLYQAAAAEYHRLRNNMIQRQGGFVKEEEQPVTSVEEEEAPRVSRFKAARLKK
ncbi:Prefoldin subunit-domain-containing protein [Echria macrotheca]|uniref:Prefoldin subunit-domain-containing protein n=1 Tax=Echria macrotheca TaxID=438768 RepID=A0AAJ0FBJ2_9PEZI|nr:Prefoldin subunit-domain-containing protein [Echria macrotheca]